MLMYGVILGEDDENQFQFGGIAAMNGNGKLAYTLFNRVLQIHPNMKLRFRI